jgi:hypothetical protein
MARLRELPPNLRIWCLVISLMVVLGCCSRTPRNTVQNAAACKALAGAMADQQQEFVDRAKSIRSGHVLLQDYDREMIGAISDRRKALQGTKLTELSVSDEVAGCSGQQLDDLRYQAQQELASLRDYLNDFNRALKSDPADVFIDQP